MYFNNLDYQLWKSSRIVNPIGFVLSTPKEICENLLCIGELKYKVYSFRKYGQPKLEKPKELKGIKRTFSVDYIPKHCSCECFIKDDDIWIKHRDYFSECLKENDDTFGTPLEYRIKYYGINSKKSSGFVYNDCWGSIVLRNEAWIKFENFIQQFSIKDDLEITYDMIKIFSKYNKVDKTEFMVSDWEKFFEKIVCETRKYLTPCAEFSHLL